MHRSTLALVVIPALGPAASGGEGTDEAPRPMGVAVILDEPGMPARGEASSPGTLAAILRDAGIEARRISAGELADPAVLDPASVDLAVIPTGESFPAEAREAFVAFLRRGGAFIATGGYAFNHLLRKERGRWVPEATVLEARRREAMRKDRSLLQNGDFERPFAAPPGAAAGDGRWRRSGPRCTIADDDPKEGRHGAKITAPEGTPHPGGVLWAELPARPGALYRVTGWMRTREVAGRGHAFMAAYQYDAHGALVRFRDFVQTRGTAPWRRSTYTFQVAPGAARIHIKLGIHEARGTAWFDDVRLGDITGLRPVPMNTATGTPRDGLEIAPSQMGLFDASFPLERARVLRTARGQDVVREAIEIRGDLRGWAASGVTGLDAARWIPLFQTYDRYDRPRGAAGALLLHHGGFYAGSAWAYFGIENIDLFRDPAGPMARAFARIARFLIRRIHLHNLATDHRLYRPGERVIVSVVAENRGRGAQRVEVRFTLREEGAERPLASVRRAVDLAPGARETVRATFPDAGGRADLVRVTAALRAGGEAIDEIAAGLVVEGPEVPASGPELRFAGNYFSLRGRPVFLFGSDDYAVTYRAACESPLSWDRMLRAARDMGVMLYENLQYTRPGHAMSGDDWRAFRAMGRLTQRYGLVFMPGILIGHDVAVGDEALAEQAALCRAYAREFCDTPGLLYYVNGDYRLRPDRHPVEVKALWNRWLRERYGTTEALRAAWGEGSPGGALGELDFPATGRGGWDDTKAMDRSRFLAWLTRRWNAAHAAAIRAIDPQHPITSEYYAMPLGGIDLVATIDGLDVANFGHFDEPGADIDGLPLRMRWNDLRMRGKGLSIGEYGVKTHPAWTVENGAMGYHIARTAYQQRQLFLAVAHYALGLGAAKIQNWCLRDDPTRVFPWGLFHPNEPIPKDVAYVHRNLSLIWRHFRPRYVAPPLAVCIPGTPRPGYDPRRGLRAAYRAFETLLGLHVDFAVIDDDHLEALTPATRAVIHPAPFANHGDACRRLLAWVRAGGALLAAGDPSCDVDRKGPRTEGIEKPGGPAARAPHAVRERVGRGVVHRFTDPADWADDAAGRREIYAAFLRAIGQRRLPVRPDAPWLHAMAQPTAKGTVFVVFNRRRGCGAEDVEIGTAAGPIRLRLRHGEPGLAAVTEGGRIIAIVARGAAFAGKEALVRGAGLKGLLALDGRDLRRSEAILAAPFETGSLRLPEGPGPFLATVGEHHGGLWTPLERLAPRSRDAVLPIDEDRATCLILVVRAGTGARWAAHLTEAVRHPERIAGY